VNAPAQRRLFAALSGASWRLLAWGALAASTPFLVGFSAASMFETSADQGGGGGLTYVGSPTSHGLTCGACHQGGAAGGGLALASDPAGLFVTGFVPGTTYVIAVRLAPERKGMERNGACKAEQGGCNRNGFVAEFLAGNLDPAGKLCTDSGNLTDQGCDSDAGKETTLLSKARAVSGLSLAQPAICGPGVLGDCIDVAGLMAAGKTQDEVDQLLMAAVKGRTEWRFQWRAPQTLGPVSFRLGAVDGDGGTRVTDAHNDYYGDDVYVFDRTLWPEGMQPVDSAGCVASRGTRRGWTASLLILAIAWGALLRRRVATDHAHGGQCR